MDCYKNSFFFIINNIIKYFFIVCEKTSLYGKYVYGLPYGEFSVFFFDPFPLQEGRFPSIYGKFHPSIYACVLQKLKSGVS
jgi:hypothetical protein